MFKKILSLSLILVFTVSSMVGCIEKDLGITFWEQVKWNTIQDEEFVSNNGVLTIKVPEGWNYDVDADVLLPEAEGAALEMMFVSTLGQDSSFAKYTKETYLENIKITYGDETTINTFDKTTIVDKAAIKVTGTLLWEEKQVNFIQYMIQSYYTATITFIYDKNVNNVDTYTSAVNSIVFYK